MCFYRKISFQKYYCVFGNSHWNYRIFLYENRKQHGQALTELLVGIIGIISVFLGFLLIAVLGNEKVTALISARCNADKMSLNGVDSSSAEPIRYWDYGEDKLPFTSDDIPVLSTTDSTRFTNHLRGEMTYHIADVAGMEEAQAYFDNLQFTDADHYVADLNIGTNSLTENFTSELSGSNIFIVAARLSKGEEQINDVLEKHNLAGVKGVLNRLFGVKDFHIKETVFIPAQNKNDRGL